MKPPRTRSRKTNAFLTKLEASIDWYEGIGRARALAGLAIAYRDENFIEEALEKFKEAAEISRAHKDWDNAAWCEYSGAICLRELGLFEEALDSLAICRQIFVDMGNLNAIGETDAASFTCLEALGRHEEAVARFRSARSIFQEVGTLGDASLYEEVEWTLQGRLGH